MLETDDPMRELQLSTLLSVHRLCVKFCLKQKERFTSCAPFWLDLGLPGTKVDVNAHLIISSESLAQNPVLK